MTRVVDAVTGLEGVIPVAAHLRIGDGGDVAGRYLQVRRFDGFGEQAALERLGHRLRSRVEPGVVEYESGAAGDLAGGVHLHGGGKSTFERVVEADDAKAAVARQDGKRRDCAGRERSQRGRRRVLREPSGEGLAAELKGRESHP